MIVGWLTLIFSKSYGEPNNKDSNTNNDYDSDDKFINEDGNYNFSYNDRENNDGFQKKGTPPKIPLLTFNELNFIIA